VLPNGDKSIVADLVIYDDNLISKILDGGLRELSAGYDCEYIERQDGTTEQTNIRVNHVALVPSGRCGTACRVHDHKEQPMTKDERKKLDEAMRLVQQLTEAFAQTRETQDCDPAVDREAYDRSYGESMKKFHRGGKPQAEATIRVNDAGDNWAEAMNAYGRRLRTGKK
jgi:hypothetical protein